MSLVGDDDDKIIEIYDGSKLKIGSGRTATIFIALCKWGRVDKAWKDDHNVLGGYRRIKLSVREGPKDDESSKGIKTVAIKVMSKQDKQDKQDRPRTIRERARDEINVWRNLKHKNIIQFYDVKETPQAVWILCQPALGGDLRNKLSNGGCTSLDGTATIIGQVLDGTAYLHKERIVHRDLKPENVVFLHKSGECVAICDFGLAFCVDKGFTLKGGSPSYIAPKFEEERRITGAVDVWSIGVMCNELLSGTKKIERTKDGNIKFKSGIWVNISEEDIKEAEMAKDFINACLKVDPEERLSSKGGRNHAWFELARSRRKGGSPVPPERK